MKISVQVISNWLEGDTVRGRRTAHRAVCQIHPDSYISELKRRDTCTNANSANLHKVKILFG